MAEAMIRKAKKIKTNRIDYAAIAAAGGLAKGPSVQLSKGWKAAEQASKLALAYEEVNKRDGNRSRVTGRALLASSGDPKRQREHNHLGNRSTHPDLITEISNIFLVSSYEHGFITRRELLVHGKDANKDLRFSWNPTVFPRGKRPPFRIPLESRAIWVPDADPRKHGKDCPYRSGDALVNCNCEDLL